jgi:hypothetical protein
LVVDKMIYLRSTPSIAGSWHPCHTYGNNKCRIDTRLACYLGWDLYTAICTCTFPLSNPSLEALQAKVMTAWSLKHEKKKNKKSWTFANPSAMTRATKPKIYQAPAFKKMVLKTHKKKFPILGFSYWFLTI